MIIYTIGFTGKTAREFFELIDNTDAKFLADIRVHNNSQLAGFTKRGNIDYFTQRLTGLTYCELSLLAPPEDIFKQYRNDKDWPLYESRYLQSLTDRNVPEEIDRDLFEDGIVLLCSEPTPEKCHRRLAAEYLRDQMFGGASIQHM